MISAPYRSNPTSPQLRVVVVGGGSGSRTILTGLRRFDIDLVSVVSVMDSGGSSGRLRDDYGVLPPGDARQCLVALASDDETAAMLRMVFGYRFRGRETRRGTRPLDGHNLGNLFISAMSDITGSTEDAYAWAGKLLGSRGRVIPVSTSSVQLCARLSDGHVLRGEAAIDVRREHPDGDIDYVYLDHPAYPTASAVEALRSADLVVLGPGDLFTSIVPNLLVDGIPEAIAQARHCVFVVNLMTKRGETDGYNASTFIQRLQEYLEPAKLDAAIVNTNIPSASVLRRYAAEGAVPVDPDLDACGVPVLAEAVASGGQFVRHDPTLLAETLMRWLTECMALTPALSALEPGTNQLRRVGLTELVNGTDHRRK
jgi:uncharacterized cofD-like protein